MTWAAEGEEALAWALDALGRLGLDPAESDEPRVRPWSTVVRVPHAAGAAWLKVPGAGSAFEPVLVAALGNRVPDALVAPLVVEPAGRWLLTADAGPSLRAGGLGGPAAWTALLVQYAQLQIALVPHVEELAALGVPDLRGDHPVAAVEALLADDDDGAVDAELRERVQADIGRTAELCRELAGGPVPPSIQHGDVHDGNVVGHGGRLRFLDWGDAAVGHPFVDLMVALHMAAADLQVTPGDPVLERLRAAYLEPWEVYADRRTLLDCSELALAVAPGQRALTWQRALLGAPGAERARWQPFVVEWLARSLEPGPLGSWRAG